MTYFDSSYDSRRYPSLQLSFEQVATRALEATRHPMTYKLGKGGRNPAAGSPGPAGLCDCSGFSAWATGHDRRQYAPGSKLTEEDSGEFWYDTNTVVKDARARTHHAYELVPRATEVRPGMLLVYPPNYAIGLRYGHIGVIVEVLSGFRRGSTVKGSEWWRYLRVADCSTGRGNQAIRVRRDARLWSAENRGGYIVRNFWNTDE